MKTLQKFPLLLALALTFNLRAATSDVAGFSGTIVDPQGNPVAGANVDCYQYARRMGVGPMGMEVTQHATTDGGGAFEFPTFNGMGLVLVTKAGFAPVWRTWYTAPTESQKIALSAPSALAGVVVDGAGRPVADAEVWVAVALNKVASDIGQPNLLYGKTARALFSVRTSAEGKFRFENFPADAQGMLAVKKTGYALPQTANPSRYDQLPFHAGQEDITINLDPAGRVTGKVVARGTGQPLANAVVSLVPTVQGVGSFMFDPGTIVSAADGSFQIPDVPAGSYEVEANFTNQPVADWVADSVPVKVAAGEAGAEVQIQAYKGGVLEVTVRGRDNHQLLADATVSVNSENFNRGGSTGANGVARFRLPPGQFSVLANKPDWSQAQTQASVTEGQTAEVTIELGAPLKVTGVVRDDSGAPVAGAEVGIYPNFGNYNTGKKTDTNGHYELNWQKPAWAGMQNQTYYLLVRDPERKLAALQEMEETTTKLDVILKPAMRVTGHVQDANGKALTNVMAYLIFQRENSSFAMGRQPVHSDEQGRIQMEALPMGERYGFSVNASGYGSAQEEMDAANPQADHYDFPPLILKVADRKLAGRVLGVNGAPVAGAQIWMQGDGQPAGNTTTDADGRFAFDAVCEGPVSVNANSKGAGGSAEAMGGDTNVVIRFNANNGNIMMASMQTLTGTVSDAAGNPAAGVSVVVTPSWGQVGNTTTDADGKYSINWQSQPGMRVAKYFAIARDVDRNLAAIEAIDTNKTSLDLQLGPALTISGTVLDTNGAPLDRANVNLNIMTGNMGGMVAYQPIKLNSDGTFTIPALPMGQQYNLYVTANGHGSAQKSVKKTQSQTNSVQLSPFKLKDADRLLAGRVLGIDQQPLAGVQVNINGAGQPNGNTRTDGTGHFKFKVCGGPITVFAFSPSGGGGGRNNYGSVQAKGGDTNVVVTMGVQQQQPRQAVERWTWRHLHAATTVPGIIRECAQAGVPGASLFPPASRKSARRAWKLEQQILAEKRGRRHAHRRPELPGRDGPGQIERHVRRRHGAAGQRRFHQPERRALHGGFWTGA
jgi:protocatechuate 3,4-dioxygenase beta subunit